jgi:sugar lactone lactonase YvrE
MTMRCIVRRVVVLGWIVATITTGCSESSPETAYRVEPLVPGGSPFHGVHGLRFDAQDNLYAVSVIGQSVFRVDTETGDVETVVGPPQGMADDIAIAADGTLVWTAIEDGIVYARGPDGTVRRLMENRRGVNAVSFSPGGERLFVTLVFYGDALYELDLRGAEPPRLIREGLGGLNAFEVNDDGMIYGPLVFGGRVVRIDPDSGRMTTVSDEFESPGALKLESARSALVLDDGRTLKRVDLETGATSLVAELPSGADNLDIDSSGRVFVSLSEVNAIVEVDPDTGNVRYVVEPAPLTSPTGLAVLSGDGMEEIYVGDLFGGVKIIDSRTGSIEETPIDIFQPAHVSVTDDHLVVVGQVFGVVELHDRGTFDLLGSWNDLSSPGDALESSDGDLVVAETGAGRLLRLGGSGDADRTVIAGGLAAPIGLAWADEGSLYVTEAEAGRLLRVDSASGAVTVLATGLAQPEGVAVAADGRPVVVEVAARRLTSVDPATGTPTVVAADLPIGLGNGPSLYRSVAAGESALYLNSDIENAIYRLTPR